MTVQKYGTEHTVDGDDAMVLTSPKKTSRVYRYPLHRHDGVWVLSRERSWYTRHALSYAERNLDEVLRRYIPPSQARLTDFNSGRVQSSPSTDEACGD